MQVTYKLVNGAVTYLCIFFCRVSTEWVLTFLGTWLLVFGPEGEFFLATTLRTQRIVVVLHLPAGKFGILRQAAGRGLDESLIVSILALLQVLDAIKFDLQLFVAQVVEQALRDALDVVLVHVVESRVLLLALADLGRVLRVVEVELVLAVDVLAEVLGQLRGVADLHLEVESHRNELRRVIWALILVDVVVAVLVARANVHGKLADGLHISADDR